MDNMNFDANTINKLQDMMNKGELNDVMAKISPEMIQSFSSMMASNNNNSNNNNNINSNFNNQTKTINNNDTQETNNSSGQNSNSSFDFSNIDMNMLLKMKSVMDKMNNSNSPSSNLLHSLKPYLRESRKEKVDQYASLLNVAQMTELFKNNNTTNKNHKNKESPK